jgi:predicted nucleotidyltransferase
MKHIDQNEFPESVQKVIAKARRELHPSEILLYGSRARGDAMETSDFDFALKGVSDDVSWTEFYNYVHHDAPTLFGIDLVRYEHIPAPLKKNIDEEGRVINECRTAQ